MTHATPGSVSQGADVPHAGGMAETRHSFEDLVRTVRGNADFVALARDADIPSQTVFRLRTGVAGTPPIAVLRAIATALGVPFEEVEAAVRVSREQRYRGADQ